MHLCMFYHRSTCTQTVYIFILRLSVQPFLGLVGEASSPNLCLHPFYVAAGIFPLGSYFTRCIPTPYVFSCDGFSAMSNIDRILRSWIHYWGSFACSTSQTFLLGVPKLSDFFLIVPTLAGLFLLSDIFGSICSCFRVADIQPLIWRHPLGSR